MSHLCRLLLLICTKNSFQASRNQFNFQIKLIFMNKSLYNKYIWNSSFHTIHWIYHVFLTGRTSYEKLNISQHFRCLWITYFVRAFCPIFKNFTAFCPIFNRSILSLYIHRSCESLLRGIRVHNFDTIVWELPRRTPWRHPL